MKEKTVDLTKLYLPEGDRVIMTKSKKTGLCDSEHSNEVTYSAKPMFYVYDSDTNTTIGYFPFVRNDTWSSWIGSSTYNDGNFSLDTEGYVLYSGHYLLERKDLTDQKVLGTATIEDKQYKYSA